MLPWGRAIERVKDRRNQDPVWSLDPEKSKVAQSMFKIYVEDGATLGEVGRLLHMNPETVRRILMEQGGATWSREFIDPATGQKVKVETPIPELFNVEQRGLLADRAKQNQTERASWAGRVRHYPLSPYIRCSNPACGWSNLSGHQTGGSKLAASVKGREQPRWAYYLHLRRARAGEQCLHSIPADDIETEIFSRLGQLLVNSSELEKAVQRALITDPGRLDTLRQDQGDLRCRIKDARRVLNSAMEVLIEQMGTPAAEYARAKVRSQNAAIAEAESRLKEVEAMLKVVEIPKDFPRRFVEAMSALTGLHGHAALHWPVVAKKQLLKVFFAGSKSTRFDRNGKGVRSDERGIFVHKAIDSSGRPYWHYEVKGLIGEFAGALTSVVELYDLHSQESIKRDFSNEELTDLAALAPQVNAQLGFRSSCVASTPRSASPSRGTSASAR
jgi:hypothetical protein